MTHHNHLATMIRDRISRYGDRTALLAPPASADSRQWQPVSWAQFGQQLDACARALLAAGTGVQQTVGIWSNNMPQWTVADFAIMSLRGISVPLYATNTAKQSQYVIEDAGCQLVFVGEQAQYDRALEVLASSDTLQQIVVFDNSVDLKNCAAACYFSDFLQQSDSATQADVDQRLAEASSDDLATLIYTSGTTGEPKGVMLSHGNFIAGFAEHDKVMHVGEDDVSLAFLPLSHVYERAWTFYTLYRGGTNAYLLETNAVKEAMGEVRPTVMCAVPRFYEKIYSTIWAKLETASPTKRAMFKWAVKTGDKVLAGAEQGRKPSPALALQHRLADKLIFSKLRGVLGGRIRFMPCGGAAMDTEVHRFFRAVGINVKVGYGMTETTATVCCHPDEGFALGTLGRILPALQVKIGDESEILVKGPTVMKGYYNKPEATAETFDADGWLKTGDAGYIDDNGNVVFTERLKELMKTANGKYIAPQQVEGMIGKDHFIEQIAIVADTRKFVSALIVPAQEAVEEYAHSIGLKWECQKELLRNSEIVEMFEKRINELQSELAKFEQVKKFTLLTSPFCQESGELTPSMKLRRKVIMERYTREIEAMYDNLTARIKPAPGAA